MDKLWVSGRYVRLRRAVGPAKITGCAPVRDHDERFDPYDRATISLSMVGMTTMTSQIIDVGGDSDVQVARSPRTRDSSAGNTP